MLGYSRNDENDVDKRAVRYTLAAGYDPNGLIRFFQILEQKGDRGGGGVAYFRTHPPTSDRISRVKQEIVKQEVSNSNAYRRSRNQNIDFPESYDPNNRSRNNRDRIDWP